VDQEQIDVVRTERLEGAIEGFARIVRPMKPVVQLAGDEDFAAIQP
jgi:hypothetical protein